MNLPPAYEFFDDIEGDRNQKNRNHACSQHAAEDREATRRDHHHHAVPRGNHRQQGDPAGGAVAGAIIGGLLGNAWSGGRGGGTLAGAVGGAMIGSAASQGQGEQRTYEVFVRFDDGALETFVYQNVLPFRVGEAVALTAYGLERAQGAEYPQQYPQQYPPPPPPQYPPAQ